MAPDRLIEATRLLRAFVAFEDAYDADKSVPEENIQQVTTEAREFLDRVDAEAAAHG